MKPIVIVGPTATGKTGLAVQLTKQFKDLTALSCDSQLVYQELDIGTAKPSKAELEALPHYGINLVLPNQSFSISDYIQAVRPEFEKLKAENKPIVIVGGTGFYLRGLLQPKHILPIAADAELREKLLNEAQGKEPHYLYNRLREIDPKRASALYKNDIQRIIRALEINLLTGKPVPEVPTDWDEPTTLIGLHFEDKLKHEALMKQRITEMLNNGWLEEVANISAKYGDCFALQNALGYTEVLQVTQGKITREEAIECITILTRQFAKRQLTWFKKIPNIHWLAVDKLSQDKLISQAQEIINREN